MFAVPSTIAAKIGGLEPTAESVILRVDDTDYELSGRFQTMLRDTIIDWETFKEVYSHGVADANMFAQILKLLNLPHVQTSEPIQTALTGLLSTLYKEPAEIHMNQMLRQFMISESMSMAMFALFSTIRIYFENMIKHYSECRNSYISKKKTTDTPNDLKALTERWESLDAEYDLDSSSTILLFLNPPDVVPRDPAYKFHVKVRGVPETEALAAAFKKFKYPGFCPKVPKKRLDLLLCFPIHELVAACKALERGNSSGGSGKTEYPDFKALGCQLSTIIDTLPQKPAIIDDYTRKSPPEGLKPMQLIMWYVDEILALRKHLYPFGKKYEEYYQKHAVALVEMTKILHRALTVSPPQSNI